jgi:hypothetical protein
MYYLHFEHPNFNLPPKGDLTIFSSQLDFLDTLTDMQLLRARSSSSGILKPPVRSSIGTSTSAGSASQEYLYTNGIIHLFKDKEEKVCETHQQNTVAFLGIPTTMSTQEFLSFLDPFTPKHIRLVKDCKILK